MSYHDTRSKTNKRKIIDQYAILTHYPALPPNRYCKYAGFFFEAAGAGAFESLILYQFNTFYKE